MPELRLDPLSGLKAIIAGERAGRPGSELGVGGREPPHEPAIDVDRDPFAEGHEGQTPPELYALRPAGGSPNGPGWSVRVVPNLYPALSPPGEPEEAERGAAVADPLASARVEPSLFSASPAIGAHEVIVSSPEPVASLAALPAEQLATAMSVWRERLRFHEDAACVHLIVNEGREAGASLPHTHAQLYALSFVPALLARERERFTAYANRTQGRNLLEDVLQEEVKRRERLVGLDDEAVAICPFASRLPFQVQILPRRPRRRFEDEGPLGAALLHDVLRRLRQLAGPPLPLNLWVRTAPRGAEHFCWRIDVVPRLATLAGLELGAGVDLNVVAPERAASLLREVSVPA